MKYPLKALRDEVIVKPVYEEKRGAIIIPESAIEYKKYHGTIQGIVISVGKDYPYDLKRGDRIAFRRHEGKVIRYEGEEYLMLKERWVEAKISD